MAGPRPPRTGPRAARGASRIPSQNTEVADAKGRWTGAAHVGPLPEKVDLRLQLRQQRRLEAVAERLGVPPRTFAREAIMRAVEEVERRFAAEREG